MKFKFIACSLILSSALLFAVSASAESTTNSNCYPTSVEIPSRDQTSGTVCIWQDIDSPMQVSFLGSKNATKGYVRCFFKAAANSKDIIKAVIPVKATEITNIKNDGKNIDFKMTAPSNGENVKVIFYVNSMDNQYTTGDQMVCLVNQQ